MLIVKIFKVELKNIIIIKFIKYIAIYKILRHILGQNLFILL